ncbi:hypothetical protein UFOVP621_23 [uncultured Caudovirales phage]|uniref:Uncharacterized protein n=1 Tax=uncultured Caudovirales phage TaxID=2100421 RepID=A0A6J5N660_9CAUD|nr:hypothetical protein UFOVP621_23 [uncultured Caudovirales phage]
MPKKDLKKSNKQGKTTAKVVHKVIDGKLEAAQVAAGLTKASAAKYPYRANALLMGLIPLRPYDPIILTGLTDNMSGIWVVLSVTHVFKKEFPYSMRVSLGSNEKLLNETINTPIKDIANTDSPIDPEYISELFAENDMFLEITNDSTGDFFIESSTFDVVTPEEDEVADSNNPVVTFINVLDQDVYEGSLDPFEGVVYDRDPFEVTPPDFTSLDLEDNWIQESY